MNKEELNKEQRILSQMRKTLGNIVKDVAPLGGRPNPLTNSTIQEIKDCFGLISEREQELANKLGFVQAKPHYADGEQPSSSALNFVKLSKKR
jgi:hypothetical protein